MTAVITDFNCNICKKYYSSYQSLWIHNKKYHNKNVAVICNNDKICCGNVADGCAITIPNKYFCNYCNRIFNHRSNKFNHEKICKLKLKSKSLVDTNNKLEKLEKENFEIKNILKELIEKKL